MDRWSVNRITRVTCFWQHQLIHARTHSANSISTSPTAGLCPSGCACRKASDEWISTRLATSTHLHFCVQAPMLFCLMVTYKKTPLTRWKMHKSLHKVNITPVWYMKTSNVCSVFCHSGNVCFTQLLGGNLEPPEFLHLSLNYDVIQKQDFLNQHNLSIPINPANAYTWKQGIFFEHQWYFLIASFTQ